MANDYYDNGSGYYDNSRGAAPQPPYGQAAYTPNWTYGSQPHYTQPAVPQPAARGYQTYSHAAQAASPVQPAAAAPAKAKAKKEKKPAGAGKTFAAGFGGAACACVLAGALAFGTGVLPAATTAATGSSGATSVVLGNAGGSTVVASDTDATLAEAVADKVLPSVVNIDIYTNQSSGGYGYFFGMPYGNSEGGSDTLVYSGLGSGVVISEDGYIITNYHVIEDADDLKVTVGGEEYEAEVVGGDESSDIAVIKVDAQGLVPIEIGSSDDLRVGEWVMTAGSPLGMEQSVATGVVSAKSRTITVATDESAYYYGGQSSYRVYAGMIQTDAVINPGNSGGALVNAQGQLVGINSVLNSTSGNYAGVGFAIPVDYAISIATQLIDGETPSHAQLGVTVAGIDADAAKQYDLPVEKGAYVNGVIAGSGAEEAGIEQGDIITKVDGNAVESATDLIGAVRARPVGSTVKVTLYRDGEQMELDVVLGSDEQNSVNKQQSRESAATPEEDLDWLGGRQPAPSAEQDAA